MHNVGSSSKENHAPTDRLVLEFFCSSSWIWLSDLFAVFASEHTEKSLHSTLGPKIRQPLQHDLKPNSILETSCKTYGKCQSHFLSKITYKSVNKIFPNIESLKSWSPSNSKCPPAKRKAVWDWCSRWPLTRQLFHRRQAWRVHGQSLFICFSGGSEMPSKWWSPGRLVKRTYKHSVCSFKKEKTIVKWKLRWKSNKGARNSISGAWQQSAVSVQNRLSPYSFVRQWEQSIFGAVRFRSMSGRSWFLSHSTTTHTHTVIEFRRSKAKQLYSQKRFDFLLSTGNNLSSKN